jgi:Leucine-rich repeat (LRR) protein
LIKTSALVFLISLWGTIGFSQKIIRPYNQLLKETPAVSSLKEVSLNPESVVHLRLRKMKLDSIPSVVKQCTNLEILDVRGNNLDSLPAWLNELPKLRYLVLSKNEFVNLPEVICQMKTLEVLRASENNLAEIPRCIVNLKKLEYLDLWSNELTELPEEVADLKGLKIFDMRVTATNQEVQENIYSWLPNTDIYFSTPCNCGNDD